MSVKYPEEVFVVGGLPTVTYESRESLGLESRISGALAGNQVVMLTGPTKSGKTVLAKSTLPDDSIWISGGRVKSEADFWDRISEEISPGYKELDAAIRPSPAKIESLLVESGRVVVFDDFHYLDQDDQRDIVRSLKSPSFDGASFILIAVPHRALDAVRAEPEMTGRILHLEVPLWEESELQEIANKGFRELVLEVDPNFVAVCARQAFGSPCLMQGFCLEFARHPTQDLSTAPSRHDFFKDCALEFATKVEFERLVKGPQQRSGRKERELIWGQKVDIYWLLFVAVADLGPRTEIGYVDLRDSMRSLVVERDMPQKHEITRVLVKLDQLARSGPGEPVLEWSAGTELLHITDPYFSYYLRFVSGAVDESHMNLGADS